MLRRGGRLPGANPDVRKRLMIALADVQSYAQRLADSKYDRTKSQAVSLPSSSQPGAPKTALQQSPAVRSKKRRYADVSDHVSRRSSRSSGPKPAYRDGVESDDDELRTVLVRRVSPRPPKPKRRDPDEEESET